MATIINDAVATAGSQGILSNRRVVDMADRIILLEPRSAPLTVILKQLPTESVFNPKFELLKDELLPRLDRVNNGAGYDNTATSIVVDNGDYFRVNDLVKVQRTGEVLRVTAVSGDTLTVTRSWGGTAAAAMNDNEQLLNLGNVSQEYSSAPIPKVTQQTTDFNYIQIVRDPFNVTDVLDSSDLYGGSELAYQAKKKGIEHVKDIEHGVLFGERAIDTSGSYPIRSTGGIDEWIVTNETDVGGTLTDLDLESFFKDGFRYGSESKMFFMSRDVTSAVNQLAQGRVELVPSDESMGLSLARWISPHGDVVLATHNLLDGDTYSQQAYLLDFDQLGYRFLQGKDTMVFTNIQDNDVAGRMDEYRTYFGLYRGHEQTCARMVNVTL